MIHISKNIFRKSSRGYIALFSVIGLGAIGLSITLSLLLSGALALKSGFDVEQKGKSRLAATACAEEALQAILDTGVIEATSSLAVGSSTCTYVITSTSTYYYLVKAQGISGVATTKINIILASSSPRIKLSSWEEVADF